MNMTILNGIGAVTIWAVLHSSLVSTVIFHFTPHHYFFISTQNLKLAVIESKSFKALDLQNLLESNKLPNPFGIITSVYTDELSFLRFDYNVLSKFVHSMPDVVYPLTHKSQDLSHDWDTPFGVCFITLKVCCDKLFDRFDVNSYDFLSKLISIESGFHKVRE